MRNYWEIDIRTIPNGNLATAFAPSAPVQRLDAPDSDKQGEGLGFTRTGRDLLTSSEGVSAPVFLIPLTNGGAITGADTTAPAADTTKPALGGLSFSSTVFKAANSGAAFSAKKSRPTGTKVSFTLSEASAVKFTVQRKAKGRKVGSKCAKPKRSNRKKKKCTRWESVRGSFTVPGKAGKNTFTFRGRIGGKKLRPASYRLTGTATDPAQERVGAQEEGLQNRQVRRWSSPREKGWTTRCAGSDRRGGNAALGRMTISGAQRAFGPPPQDWPAKPPRLMPPGRSAAAAL